MKNIYLVDTEHFNDNSLSNELIFDNNDLIILFLTERTNQQYFNENKLNTLFKDANNIKRINLLTSSNSNTNFQILNHLNSLLISSQHTDTTYYIVSEDKTFNSSIDLLNNCSDYFIKLISSPSNFTIDSVEQIQNDELLLYDEDSLDVDFNRVEISEHIEDFDNNYDILNPADPFLNQNSDTFIPIDNSSLKEHYGKILATLTHEENRLIAALRSKGYQRNTGLKIVSIIRSSKDQSDALLKILSSFSEDQNIFNHILESLLKYFKSEESLEPALAD